MKIQVFDTYVKDNDGNKMHFDVFCEEGKILDFAITCAEKYLKNTEHGTITTKECRLCHTQDATKEQEKEIKENGYFIYKMTDNCP